MSRGKLSGGRLLDRLRTWLGGPKRRNSRRGCPRCGGLAQRVDCQDGSPAKNANWTTLIVCHRFGPPVPPFALPVHCPGAEEVIEVRYRCIQCGHEWED